MASNFVYREAEISMSERCPVRNLASHYPVGTVLIRTEECRAELPSHVLLRGAKRKAGQ